MSQFDRIASIYDVLKKFVFQNSIDKASIHFIDQIPAKAKVLLIGGGSGNMLPYFKKGQEVLYVDQSKKMIRKAMAKNSNANITFSTGNIFTTNLYQEFDCIITPFFLDCLNQEELSSLFYKLLPHLKNEGAWIQTDFYPQNLRHRVLVRIMYFFFRLTTALSVKKLANFDLAFKNFGFEEKNKVRFKHGLIQSKFYRKIG